MSKSNKSFAAIGKNVCPICNIVHDRNAAVLVHKYLKDIEDTVIGYELCQEHQDLHEQGYLALVGAVPDDPDADTITLRDVQREGGYLHIKREAFTSLTGENAPSEAPFVFVHPLMISEFKGLRNGTRH